MKYFYIYKKFWILQIRTRVLIWQADCFIIAKNTDMTSNPAEFDYFTLLNKLMVIFDWLNRDLRSSHIRAVMVIVL